MRGVDAPVPLTLKIRTESFAYKQPFRISGHLFTATEVIVAELSDGIHLGQGEAAGVYYLGDDVPAMLTAVSRGKASLALGRHFWFRLGCGPDSGKECRIRNPDQCRRRFNTKRTDVRTG